MGTSKKQLARISKLGTTKFEESEYCVPTPDFDADNYWIWESKMEVHLQAHGVWESIVSRDTSTDEAKGYNSKAMNVIFNVLPNSVKTKVGQCSTPKALWEKLHNSTKQLGQDVIENSDRYDYDEEIEEMSKTEFQNQVIKVIKELKSQKEKTRLLEAELKTTKELIKENEESEKMISSLSTQLEEVKNTETQELKREIQQKQQELDTTFAEISRLKQQMQKAEIERKESDQIYISTFDQKQKELETYSVEVSRLRIENEEQKEHIQVLNKEVEKTTLLKLQVEEVEKRRDILKRWFQEDFAQKQEELDATRDEVNGLKGLQKEHLQDKFSVACNMR